MAYDTSPGSSGNVVQSSSQGYNTQPGMTGQIAGGGEYDDFSKTDVTEFNNVAANAVVSATAQAQAAAASAVSAASSASSASTSAGTATTQANTATSAASAASGSATAAANSAATAANGVSSVTALVGTANAAASSANNSATAAAASALAAYNSEVVTSAAAATIGTSVSGAATSAAEAASSAAYAEEMAQLAADHTRLEAGHVTDTGVGGEYRVEIVGTPGNQVLDLWIPEFLGPVGPTSVFVSATEPTPANLASGSTLKWFDLNTGIEYTKVNDGDSTQWAEVGGIQAAATTAIIVSATAPDTLLYPAGYTIKWFDLTTGVEYTKVDDGDSIQWIEVGGVQATVGSGTSSTSFETVSKNLSAYNFTLGYTGSQLTTVTYSNGVVKTFTYTSGVLTSITLSGSTPASISLTKTLTYTSGKLTGVTYS